MGVLHDHNGRLCTYSIWRQPSLRYRRGGGRIKNPVFWAMKIKNTSKTLHLTAVENEIKCCFLHKHASEPLQADMPESTHFSLLIIVLNIVVIFIPLYDTLHGVQTKDKTLLLRLSCRYYH